MKVAVIGAGISGLSIGKLLVNLGFNVDIYEKENNHGGIARVRMVDNIPYHLVGGHCFNSKNDKVLNFIFENVLSKENWNLVGRKASIYFRNHFINYPIEYSLGQIYSFDKNFALNIVEDFFKAEFTGEEKNLEDWFIAKFGKSLAQEYFIPYNRKIWNEEPRNMSHEWVKDKLPIPDKLSFLDGIFSKAKDNMSHSSFYYPKKGTQNVFHDALAVGLNIVYNYNVKDIQKRGSKWVVNHQEYDVLINTSPINEIHEVFTSNNLLEKLTSKLRFNEVTTMLWERKELDWTWTYIPEEHSICHRHIHIGNFTNPKTNYSIAESTGYKTYEQMKTDGEKFDYLIRPIDYNVSKQAYVVFDQNHKEYVNNLMLELEKNNVYSLGRFGEWEYYNMDVCIEKAINLAERLHQKYN